MQKKFSRNFLNSKTVEIYEKKKKRPAKYQYFMSEVSKSNHNINFRGQLSTIRPENTINSLSSMAEFVASTF